MSETVPGAPAVRRARAEDIDAIRALLAANTREQGGALHGSFPPARIAAWLADAMPAVVAQIANRLVGVLFTASPARAKQTPVLAAMLAAYPARSDAYVYGPVCIDATARGMGILALLFAEVERILPGREAILFIRDSNIASRKAHAKLGMRRIAAFRFEGEGFGVFSSLPQAAGRPGRTPDQGPRSQPDCPCFQ